MKTTNHPFAYPLYLVTNEAACLGRDLFQVTEQALKGGVDLVQLREKDLSNEAFLNKALRMKELLDRYQVPLIINDNLWVAQQCGAFGIHVGGTDVSPASILKQWPDCKLLGFSMDWEAQLQNEDVLLSDYIGLGTIFPTQTKTDTASHWGLEGLRTIRAICPKPIIAIGGIALNNAASIIEAGADSLAVVSAICSAASPAKAAEELRNEIEKGLALQL